MSHPVSPICQKWILFFSLFLPQPAIFATAGVHPTRSLEFLPIPQRYTIGNLSAEAFTLTANANTAAIEAFDAEIAAKNAVLFLLSLQRPISPTRRTPLFSSHMSELDAICRRRSSALIR